MKIILIATLFGLVSCNEVKKVEFTALQKEYLASLPLEGKVYMEACLDNTPNLMDYCMKYYHRELRQSGCTQEIQKTSGPGIGTIAAGTALGVIGAKVLTGGNKRKK
jgi:hypothetical protein